MWSPLQLWFLVRQFSHDFKKILIETIFRSPSNFSKTRRLKIEEPHVTSRDKMLNGNFITLPKNVIDHNAFGRDLVGDQFRWGLHWEAQFQICIRLMITYVARGSWSKLYDWLQSCIGRAVEGTLYEELHARQDLHNPIYPHWPTLPRSKRSGHHFSRPNIIKSQSSRFSRELVSNAQSVVKNHNFVVQLSKSIACTILLISWSTVTLSSIIIS